MDLGIKGRTALLMASSQGLGLACAIALAQEGCDIVINGRDKEKLSKAADSILRLTAVSVGTVVADLNTDEGRGALIEACPSPDILVTNNAGPPPGKLADWDRALLLEALEANMLAPALVIREVVPGMRSRRFGRIINITSAMVKAPMPMMGLSSAARMGLVAFSKAVSRDVAIDNVTINNLLPARIDTDRQRFMADRIMNEEGVSREEARAMIVATIAAKRFGKPEEFGAACAFLCSVQASFISGQNLQVDGGSYVGVV
jgi:3-oxoacyl-[acyl-carrier protein] reductase